MISFISPVYNSEQWIDKLIDSIPLEYAHEILICDDASTDNTLKILKEKNIDKLRIIENSENKGSSYSYNRLLKEVSGEYIAIIDSDDYYLPEIKKVCKLVNGRYDIYWYDLIATSGEIFKARRNGLLWSGCLKIFKRSIIGNALFGAEGKGDVAFTKEVFKNSKSNLYTKTIAYHYNYPRDNSVHDRFVKGKL